MRWPNDRKLAQEVDEIDLVLGGHDHDFNDEIVSVDLAIMIMFRMITIKMYWVIYYI